MSRRAKIRIPLLLMQGSLRRNVYDLHAGLD